MIQGGGKKRYPSAPPCSRVGTKDIYSVNRGPLKESNELRVRLFLQATWRCSSNGVVC